MENELVSLQVIARDAKDKFVALLKSLSVVREKFSTVYGKDDLRVDFFVVFSELVMWTIIQLENFHEDYPKHKVDKSSSFHESLATAEGDNKRIKIAPDVTNSATQTAKPLYI